MHHDACQGLGSDARDRAVGEPASRLPIAGRDDDHLIDPAGRDPEATPADFPLSAPGPYQVGVRPLATTDPTRGNRPVDVLVWYPAVRPADDPGTSQVAPDRIGRLPAPGADPDPSGAPYPLILSSTKVAGRFAPLLVTHGFVWASVDNIDAYDPMNDEMIDQPLDILFTLDQVAANPPEGLQGLIDTDRAGAIGYSFDGYNALALSGARVDPEYYRAQCPTPDDTTAAICVQTFGLSTAVRPGRGMSSLRMPVRRSPPGRAGCGSR